MNAHSFVLPEPPLVFRVLLLSKVQLVRRRIQLLMQMPVFSLFFKEFVLDCLLLFLHHVDEISLINLHLLLLAVKTAFQQVHFLVLAFNLLLQIADPFFEPPFSFLTDIDHPLKFVALGCHLLAFRIDLADQVAFPLQKLRFELALLVLVLRLKARLDFVHLQFVFLPEFVLEQALPVHELVAQAALFFFNLLAFEKIGLRSGFALLLGFYLIVGGCDARCLGKILLRLHFQLEFVC